MVKHLHELMQTTEGITAVLPQLYTALVGGAVALCANAVRAIGELAPSTWDPHIDRKRTGLIMLSGTH